MESAILSAEVVRYDSAENIFLREEKLTSVEKIFEVILNGEIFRSIYCSPINLDDLAVGILFQAKKIFTAADIKNLAIDADKSFIKIETVTDANCNEDFIFEKDFPKFKAAEILKCADKVLGELSTTHAKTNGVHCGALFDAIQNKILVFREDISRHNVFDKLCGWAILNKINLTDKILIFSGRCSTELVYKLRRMGISTVMVKSVPTTLSINTAKKLGITLIGRLSAGSFYIYTNYNRIVL